MNRITAKEAVENVNRHITEENIKYAALVEKVIDEIFQDVEEVSKSGKCSYTARIPVDVLPADGGIYWASHFVNAFVKNGFKVNLVPLPYAEDSHYEMKISWGEDEEEKSEDEISGRN